MLGWEEKGRGAVSKASTPPLGLSSCVVASTSNSDSCAELWTGESTTGRTGKPGGGTDDLEIRNQERCSLRLFLVMDTPQLPDKRHCTNVAVHTLKAMGGGVGRVVNTSNFGVTRLDHVYHGTCERRCTVFYSFHK